MNSLRPYVTTLCILVVSISATAQFRKYSNEFLNIGAGARGLAMGGAQVASVSDGTAGYWNPAGLVGVTDHPQVNLMHAEYFAGIGKYDYASIAFPGSNNKRSFAVTGLRFAVDDIMNTLFLVEPDGSINYNNIQAFSSADYAFIFSFAQKLKESTNKNIQFGVNAKVIHRSVGKFAKAWGFGLDAGLQIIQNKWRFGIAGRDISVVGRAILCIRYGPGLQVALGLALPVAKRLTRPFGIADTLDESFELRLDVRLIVIDAPVGLIARRHRETPSFQIADCRLGLERPKYPGHAIDHYATRRERATTAAVWHCVKRMHISTPCTYSVVSI